MMATEGNGASLMAQRGKNPPAMQEIQEMQILFLGWEDLLEEGMAIHSNIFFLENPVDRGAYSHKESDMTEATEFAHTHSCNY